MGRPRKNTAEYIPIDVNDGKTFFTLEKRWGNDGFAFWVKLLRLLGRSEGLYFRLDDTTQDYFFAAVGVDENVGYDIINMLVKMENIDRELWEKERIIWCQGLVDRLEPMFERGHREAPRKPTGLEFCDAEPHAAGSYAPQNSENSELCDAKVQEDDNNVELCGAKVHKVKESKVKEREVKETKGAHGARAADEPPPLFGENLFGDGDIPTPEPKTEKRKNKKDGAVGNFVPPEHLAGVWPDYIAMRNSAKRGKDTCHALELIVAKLQELAPDDAAKQRAIIEQSIINRWVGVFPLKNTTSGGARYGPQEVDKKTIYENSMRVLEKRYQKLEAQYGDGNVGAA